MIRTIIRIDADKCDGCGLCVAACHEGAIGLENGKARLLRDDYCDGLGNCLPVCPTGAISFEEREAAAYDEALVAHNLALHKTTEQASAQSGHGTPCAAAHTSCPGSRAQPLLSGHISGAASGPALSQPHAGPAQPNHLAQWPVQLQLVPAKAAFFEGAHVLIAADCAAYAYGNFHQDFMRGKVTLIACPKLDSMEYTAKLRDIITNNNISALTLTRMHVPCCGGLEQALRTALADSGKSLPLHMVTLMPDGTILA